MSLTRRRLQQPINESYTLGEEILHGLTHGVGAVLSLAALVALVFLALRVGTVWHIVSFPVFGVTLLAVFLASTLYHGVQRPRLRPILRKVDHACIYLLIAGTYTPFVLVTMRSTLGLSMLALVWALAISGIVYKAFFIDRHVVISTLVYVAMGWMSVFAWRQMTVSIPQPSLLFLMIGGAFYTIGVIFYALTRIRFTHAIWHFFILGGGACHFIAVLTLLPPLQTWTWR
jgi:hemolysin III